ncbi:MAG: succinate dehydrogenase cytochrome b subunit [Planctomycetaceae bacterium]|nr:succinate dehydrogenase cytochrome b subunit [Planctomycetaceae bacterium]
MSWLLKALQSSVGKKFVMAITGLLLCGFLVAHLAGNLLLYVGAKQYNDYAHALHDKAALLFVAELGLLLLFVAHVYLAFTTSRWNQKARETDYAMRQTKIRNRQMSLRAENWMFTSGAIVLAFVLLHLSDFRFELRNSSVHTLDPYEKAVVILSDPITQVGYTVGCLILGIHLAHGVGSAFQTLGANHPRYHRMIHGFGVFFAVVIALGFISFPIWGFLKNAGKVPAKPAAVRVAEPKS